MITPELSMIRLLLVTLALKTGQVAGRVVNACTRQHQVS